MRNFQIQLMTEWIKVLKDPEKSKPYNHPKEIKNDDNNIEPLMNYKFTINEAHLKNLFLLDPISISLETKVLS